MSKLTKLMFTPMALVLLIAASVSAFAQGSQSGPPWGPETPYFNLEVVLRGEGFGLIKFRQPNDNAFIVYLDVWVRDLAPNTSYLLQRAVDTNVDDNCTSTAWLTLGRGRSEERRVGKECRDGGVRRRGNRDRHQEKSSGTGSG